MIYLGKDFLVKFDQTILFKTSFYSALANSNIFICIYYSKSFIYYYLTVNNQSILKKNKPWLNRIIQPHHDFFSYGKN